MWSARPPHGKVVGNVWPGLRDTAFGRSKAESAVDKQRWPQKITWNVEGLKAVYMIAAEAKYFLPCNALQIALYIASN